MCAQGSLWVLSDCGFRDPTLHAGPGLAGLGLGTTIAFLSWKKDALGITWACSPLVTAPGPRTSHLEEVRQVGPSPAVC